MAVTRERATAAGVMANLHAALDDAHALGRLSLNMDELEAFVMGAVQVAERAKALAAVVMSDADHAGMVVRNGGGVQSLTTYVAGKTGAASAAIAPYRTIGLWLDSFPVFSSAWARGVLTDAHVRELKKLDGPRTRSDLVDAQEAFIASAKVLCFRDWMNTLGYWLLHADPDGTIPPSREIAYGLTTSTDPNGDVHIKGTLDPISGEALLTAIEYEAAKILDQQTQTNNNGAGGGLAMSHRRRMLVALARLVVRGAQRPDGSYPVPLVNIVMSEQVAEDLIDRYSPQRAEQKISDTTSDCSHLRSRTRCWSKPGDAAPHPHAKQCSCGSSPTMSTQAPSAATPPFTTAISAATPKTAAKETTPTCSGR